jgi:glyoxylase-like metal-dependent hydrolase (beta-lactamase superfamily II)
MVNCFLVREEDGLTLVDTNIPGHARSILQAAELVGAPVLRILLTHAHFDHVGSVDALSALLPKAELMAGAREARLLAGDSSLDPGEHGKKLLGFKRVRARPVRLLYDGDQIGSLRVVETPGHTPGHISLIDCRDNSLVAGDAYVTQTGVVAAGTFHIFFPPPALFSWNGELSSRSAAKLWHFRPTRLAVGHGPTIVEPYEQMKRAVEEAYRQHPAAKTDKP